MGWDWSETVGSSLKNDFCRDEYDVVYDIRRKYDETFKASEGPVVYRKGDEFWIYYDSGREDLKVSEISAKMNTEDTIRFGITLTRKEKGEKDYQYGWVLKKIEAPSGVRKVNIMVIEEQTTKYDLTEYIENSDLFIFD